MICKKTHFFKTFFQDWKYWSHSEYLHQEPYIIKKALSDFKAVSQLPRLPFVHPVLGARSLSKEKFLLAKSPFKICEIKSVMDWALIKLWEKKKIIPPDANAMLVLGPPKSEIILLCPVTDDPVTVQESSHVSSSS